MSEHLRIVRGDPTPEELAAITAVVTVAAAPGDEAAERPVRGRWNDPAHAHRRYWRPGPGGWLSAR